MSTVVDGNIHSSTADGMHYCISVAAVCVCVCVCCFY